MKLSYNLEEAVAATGIQRSTIDKEITAGLLKARKRGSTTLILTEDLKAYLDALPARQAAAER